MTATTLTAPTRPTPTHRVTFPRVVASEWIKLRTVRSTMWTLGMTVLLMVGISLLVAWGSTTEEVTGDLGAASLLTSGYMFGQLTLVVLGVLTVTGEYSTGMVRSTFAAVPRRLPALAAKALVLTVVVIVASVVAMALSYVATLGFHDRLGITLDLTEAETLRMLAGLPLYLVAVTLLAFAVGALMRHSAGALAAVLGLLLVIENVFALIPLRFFELVSPFLPSTAGSRILLDAETLAMIDTAREGATLTPWQGYGVLVAWVVVLLAAAAVLLRRRDA